MHVVVAMDSFKGSLNAEKACRAVRDGLMAASDKFDVDMMPVADGGEGFLSVLAGSTGGEMVFGACHDPLGRAMRAPFLRMPDESVVVETAAASGLTLIRPEERDIMHSTTYGTGEQLMAALKSGAKRIYVGLGGSATCDGGIGLMRALGIKFLDCDGHEIEFPADMRRLQSIDAANLTPLISQAECIAACDVDSPLTGKDGAAYVFGPQKGAKPEQVEQLDAGLVQLSAVMRETGFNMERPGAGAAGGLGGAFSALGFRLCSGVDTVLEIVHARKRIEQAELVIVGEGMTDSQTAAGKAPCGIARLAHELGRAAVCISGSLGNGYQELYSQGITAAFASVARPMELVTAMNHAREYLFDKARDVGRLWLAARNVKVEEKLDRKE